MTGPTPPLVSPGARKLRVAQKLVLIVVTLLIPVGVLTYLLLQTYGEQSLFDRQEIDGLNYLRPLRKVSQGLQDYRTLTAAAAAGDAASKQAAAAKEAQVDEAVKAVDAAERQTTDALRATKKWKAITDRWAKAKAQWADVKGKKGKPAAVADLTASLAQLVGDVGEASNLILDPALDSYWTQDVLTVRISELTGLLDDLRAEAAGVALRKARTPDDEEQLQQLVGKVRLSLDLLGSDTQSVMDANDGIKARIAGSVKAANEAADGFLALVKDKLLKPAKVDAPPADVLAGGGKALDAAYKLADDVDPVLFDLLARRVAAIERNTVVAYTSLAVGLLLALAVVFFITRGITRQVAEIRRMFERIGRGDYSARAGVVSSDELGEMARAVNDQLLPLVQSHEDRERLQAAITKLLEEVAGVAEGDLTGEAEVTADATGALADSFNYMTDQLRKIIGEVQSSTIQVSSSANQVYQTTEALAAGSVKQAEKVRLTSAAVEDIAASTQRVSAGATTSATVAQQALDSARRGNAAVKNTIRGMNRIRKQVQETAKRIKRLGESSQEIGQIVQLISDISERTSILALNASIQASMAGEAGRGFAVVAEEVERLAVRSTDATKKIGGLVKTIQGETGEAVAAMEKGIADVVDGSKLANQAGQALEDIEAVSNQLAELIHSISAAAGEQARSSEEVAKSMADIARFTEQTAVGARAAATSVNRLTVLASGLRSSVSTFRLPGEALPPAGADARNGDANGARPATRFDLQIPEWDAPASTPELTLANQ